jgi:hypothetical protein
MKHRLFLTVAGIVRAAGLAAQLGCTDAQAANFNAQATQNDGSCLYAPTNYATVLVSTLADTLKECSGLVAAGGFWWALNDGGNDDTFMRINPLSGAVGQYVKLKDADNEDWEDMTTDGAALYVGDFGNNATGVRTDLGIYRVPLDEIGGGFTTSVEGDEHQFLEFSYEDQTDFTPAQEETDVVFDCEAMLHFNGKIHLFTKNWSNRTSTQYVLDADSTVARRRNTLVAGGLISGAAMSPDSQVVVLVGYEKNGLPTIFMWLLWDFEGDDFFSGHKRRIELGTPLTNGQSEGVAFTGARTGYIVNEAVTFGGVTFAQQMVRSFDLSAWIPGGSSSTEAVVAPDWSVYPNPFSDFLSLKCLLTSPDRGGITLPVGEGRGGVQITDLLGRTWYSGAWTDYMDTAHWPAGSYMVRVGGAARLVVKM